jgi:hypothetical protein
MGRIIMVGYGVVGRGGDDVGHSLTDYRENYTI